MEASAGRAVMDIEMKIKGLMIDPITNMPIIILRDPGSDAILPIWVGIFEANAIALELEKISPPRSMTHDLLRSVIEGMGGKVSRIIVSELKENTFFARILIDTGNGETEIDSRPSDAIALALRCAAPIFVRPEVVDLARNMDMTQDSQDNQKLRRWLETLDEKEMGKYEM